MTPEREMATRAATVCAHCIDVLGVGWPNAGPHGRALQEYHAAHLLIDALRDSLPRYSSAPIYRNVEMDRA